MQIRCGNLSRKTKSFQLQRFAYAVAIVRSEEWHRTTRPFKGASCRELFRRHNSNHGIHPPRRNSPPPPHPQSSSHVSLIYLDFGNQSSRASTKSSRFLLAESTFLSRREYFPALGLSSTLKSTGIKSSRNGRGIQKP
jgi:hypothetical protein